MSELLRLDNLTIGAETSIVKKLSLTLQNGEKLGIVGESGSGKTLSALSLAGLLPGNLRILSGSITLNLPDGIVQFPGANKTQMLQLRRKALGFVFQEPMSALNPVKCCGYQLMENLQMSGLTDKNKQRLSAIKWMEEVQLPDPERIMDAYPHQLSGGQRQRLMIAMAMCNHPLLLIADEPTTALDVKVRDVVLDLMELLCEKYNTALLLISHDLKMVANRCENIAVLKNGTLCEYGTASELVNNPKHPYTKALWACRPDPNHRLIPLPTVGEIVANKYMAREAISHEAWKNIGWKLQQKTPLLRGQALTFAYGDNQILNGMDFELYPGESLGILGESGCGKSTLSRIICGLEAVQGGILEYYDGLQYIDLAAQKRLWRAERIQMIFQDSTAALNPNHRIGRILGETRKHFFPQEKREKRNGALLAMIATMGLPEDSLMRYPHSFSGGQKQRICIARALLAEPRILICDESVAALDVSVQAQILNLLHHIRESMGVSFIFISHDPNTVRYFCHRVVEMNKGNVERIT